MTYANGGASTGAKYNPFRYRGYYYDTDLGMYYLNSRYYDSKICRFINADTYVSTGQSLTGNNMFAYCDNNPVMRCDFTGEFSVDLKDDDNNPFNDYMRMEGGGASGHGGGGIGFDSFSALKKYQGSAGSNNHWHHVVEKCQIDKSGFSSQQIHNTSNVVSVDPYTHYQISGHYVSKQWYTGNLNVRNWLAGKPFEFQSWYGWKVYNQLMIK